MTTAHEKISKQPWLSLEAGMIGLTHFYATLLAKEGITSNAIAPAQPSAGCVA